MQNGAGYALRQRHLQAQKMNVTWYPILVSFQAPNKIQPGEYSMGDAIDGIGYAILVGESERQRQLPVRQHERPLELQLDRQ